MDTTSLRCTPLHRHAPGAPGCHAPGEHNATLDVVDPDAGADARYEQITAGDFHAEYTAIETHSLAIVAASEAQSAYVDAVIENDLVAAAKAVDDLEAAVTAYVTRQRGYLARITPRPALRLRLAAS